MAEGRHRQTTAPPVIAADPARAARTEPPATDEPPRLPVAVDGHRAAAGTLPPGRREELSIAEPASVDELVQSMKVLAARLVRNELALAKIGFRRRIKHLVAGVAMLGTGGLLAFFGLGCLVAAAIQGLNLVVQDWWACWIVAGGMLVTALLVVLPGWRGVRGRHPVRAHTLQSIKQDIATLRNALRR